MRIIDIGEVYGQDYVILDSFDSFIRHKTSLKNLEYMIEINEAVILNEEGVALAALLY